MATFRNSAILSILLLPVLLFATVTNLQMTTPHSINSGEAVGFLYSSDEDTVHSLIYIETEGNPVLDTANDRFFYHIIQTDNGTLSDFQNQLGYLEDGNDTLGRYLWYIPDMDLPAGLYWVCFYNNTGLSQVDTFRMLPVANPYRTITGNVTPPVGRQKSFIQVNADEENSRFSAFTDTSGDYSIAIDSATLANTSDTVFRVRAEGDFPGYMVNPIETQVDIRTASAGGIDFTYDSITSGVRVTLLSGSTPLPGVYLGLSDSATWAKGSNGQTDSTGFCLLGAAAGVYWLNMDNQSLGSNYMSPGSIVVHVMSGQFVDTTITLVPADTAIYGRLTKDGGNPGGNYRVDLRSDIGGTSAEPDSNGYFRLPASTLATQTSVTLVTWDNKYDTIPAGYYIAGGSDVNVQLGDTVLFNMVPMPNGAVICTVSNSSVISCDHVHFTVGQYDTLTQLKAVQAFNFDMPFTPGPFTLAGIADGVYALEITMGNGFNPVDWRLRKSLEFSPGVEAFFIINDDTALTAVTFTDTDTIPNLARSQDADNRPVVFSLSKPSPNPFNPTVNIRFDVPTPSRVTLDVYDISGRHVVRLLDEVRSTGSHRVMWAAKNANNSGIASGVYVVRMQSGRFVAKQKLVFLK
ncbi:MAG: T9SS type A sorting domain-containing protein [Fibrobacterota bacterium]